MTSFAFNLWIVGGKFYYKGGNNAPLPLSTEGCSHDVIPTLTTVTTTTLSSDLYNSTLPPDITFNTTLQMKQ